METFALVAWIVFVLCFAIPALLVFITHRHASRDEPFEIGDIHNCAAYFDWHKAGCGFGQLSFALHEGRLTCMNECMSRKSVRKILHAFADKIADEVVLLDEV